MNRKGFSLIELIVTIANSTGERYLSTALADEARAQLGG